MNFIRQLDTYALGSRLKNLSDILYKDVKKIYKEQGIKFEPRWFTTVRLLHTKGQLSITEIAEEINQTHPAVNQTAKVLEKEGLIEGLKDKDDNRKRILKLTGKGKRLIKKLQPLWDEINNATSSFIIEHQPDLLQIISKMENALLQKSMYLRIKDQIKKAEYSKIKILTYSNEYKSYFRDLNYQWLNKYFKVEPKDEFLLNNPEKEIIQKGGAVIFAELNEKIAGTAAILKLNDKECEIAKMAVDPKYQGKQIGRKLLNEAVNICKEMKFEKIILLTATQLTKALNMYESAGFKKVKPRTKLTDEYSRKTIMMEMNV